MAIELLIVRCQFLQEISTLAQQHSNSLPTAIMEVIKTSNPN